MVLQNCINGIAILFDKDKHKRTNIRNALQGLPARHFLVYYSKAKFLVYASFFFKVQQFSITIPVIAIPKIAVI